jgi:hypothetical protein
MSDLLAEIQAIDAKLAASISTDGVAGRRDLTRRCLEALSRFFCELVNRRDFDHHYFQRFLSPYFKASTERGIITQSRQEYISMMREASSINPGYSVDSLNVCASVRKGIDARATVWMTMRVHGLPERIDLGLVREVVSKFKWVRLDGRWVWIGHVSMRGLAWRLDAF